MLIRRYLDHAGKYALSANHPHSGTKRFSQVKYIKYDGSTDTELPYFDPLTAARFKKGFRSYPAITKWFNRALPGVYTDEHPKLNTEYLDQFGDTTVPLERTSIDDDKFSRSWRPPTFEHFDEPFSRTTTEGNGIFRFKRSSTYERFDAPLSLLMAHMAKRDAHGSRLYLAQHSIADLPAAMQEDLPTPSILKDLGKGDMYGSSVWMGRAPTRTPLHRDPNPNLFLQVAGKKIVRLFEPGVGLAIYEKVRESLGKPSGTVNIRGEEMMQGRELEAMENAVWNDGPSKYNPYSGYKGVEVLLKSVIEIA
ncbi:hypothetical protein CC86DRAFT_461652 [Ophiobolus disseminans]|uniref:Cupin-like domain-containing protein n=1 Tax=Ophiobolus disseminans TaxID=1469910 RepID=A0A6A7AKK3_9PLEO|nr:hypothetical protein CC86DRAFT_461652 [Ophiobolus disseminans]